MLALFTQTTGINGIVVYASRLLEKMNEQDEGGEKFPLTPIQGTYIIGFANALGASIPILYANKIGRRPVFIYGSLAVTISLFFCGLAILKSWNLTSFIMIIVFIFFFHFSYGDFLLLYIPEVCLDSASGFAMASNFINCMIVALTFEYMINSPLKVYGTIWYFSAFTFISFIFCVFIVRETLGLSDLEKKTVYSPKDELAAAKET